MLIKRIHRGCVIPRFYGPYRYEIVTGDMLCMPMPFCFIVGLLQAFLSALKWSYREVISDPRDAYEQGYQAGKASKEESPKP